MLGDDESFKFKKNGLISCLARANDTWACTLANYQTPLMVRKDGIVNEAAEIFSGIYVHYSALSRTANRGGEHGDDISVASKSIIFPMADGSACMRKGNTLQCDKFKTASR